jgi:glycosyltransferase involved in cell wall biosynthesis
LFQRGFGFSVPITSNVSTTRAEIVAPTEVVNVSVVVTVGRDHDDIEALYAEYRNSLQGTVGVFEFIYVVDSECGDALAALRRLRAQDEPITVLTFAKWFGHASGLSAGFAKARGEVILTLPAVHQVEAKHIPLLLEALRNCDMAVGRRVRVAQSGWQKLQSQVFNYLLRQLADASFGDISCDARALKREVAKELTLYGEQYRFLPILVQGQGFKVREVDIPPSPRETRRSLHPLDLYVSRVLDILSLFFLSKFARKPLRFFGMIGSVILAFGSLATAVILAQRVFGGQPLMERPALIIGVLMVVVGIQIIAVGLVAEILIFTRSKDLKEYRISEIVE